MDGSKALTSAIKKICGTEHPIQRCRFHKLSNVLDRLPQAKNNYVRAAMQAAWRLPEKRGVARMKELARELEVSHPDAARSLLEGLEETFTVGRLDLPPLLVESLGTTNLIENAHGAIQAAIHRVKRFCDPKDALRWAATALLEAENGMRTVKGVKQLWMLQAALGRSDPGERGIVMKQGATGNLVPTKNGTTPGSGPRNPQSVGRLTRRGQCGRIRGCCSREWPPVVFMVV